MHNFIHSAPKLYLKRGVKSLQPTPLSTYDLFACVFTYLICYLWTQGVVKLTEKYALDSTCHSHR